MKKRVQRNKVGPLRGPLLISLYKRGEKQTVREGEGRNTV